MNRRDALFAVVCIVAAIGLFAYLPKRDIQASADLTNVSSAMAGDATLVRLNQAFSDSWDSQNLEPAPAADRLQVARRLSLALVGATPSLEEIRRLESVPENQRVDWWMDQLLSDRRYADYIGERLARVYVGTEDGPFVLFRRRRFVSWLSDCLHADMPYDELVRHLIADEGIWTIKPAVNFVTVTFSDETERPDPVRLAAKTTRAFLGVRLDCMQCHDDNLGGSWMQSDFHELAAFYAEPNNSIHGIADSPEEYKYTYLHADEEDVVDARVPFDKELFARLNPHASDEAPFAAASSESGETDDADEGDEVNKADGSSARRREQLAQWVTHPENDAFARAMVNRAWALMFGKPMVEPIDSVPLDGPWPVGMEILAEDFVANGYDLKRLWRLIAASDAFQRDSRAAHELGEAHEAAWAAFPLTRLRPEQVAGSIIQSASLTTIDADSHIITRFSRFDQQNNFVTRYGDTGDDEFAAHGGTIPQRLLMMNGELVLERTKDDLVANAATRIASLAPNDESGLEAAYLAVLTRRPSEAELDHFRERLDETDPDERKSFYEDLYWSLFNAIEFSWNH